jgi:predicted TIM-barrel fold metal-dependent hydrolase
LADSGRAMIVDAHTHLLPERLGAAIRRFFAERVTGGVDQMVYPFEPVAARAAIVAAGVDRCWSLPYVRRPGVAAALNRWMAETYGGDEFVIAGATAHPEDDVRAVVGEALDDLGLRVLKLHCSVAAHRPDDPRLDPLWERVSARGQPVVVHAGGGADGVTTPEELAAVGRLARRWPDARIVVAHCGAPSVEATLGLLRGTRSVYADLTPVIGTPVPLERAQIRGLERRLLFGTDAPNTGISIEDSLARVRAWRLPPADEAAILGGTAERLVAGR